MSKTKGKSRFAGPNGDGAGSNGNGRGPGGKFAPGNPGGPGNPHAADVGRLRAAFFAAIRDDDVVKALAVIREVLDDKKAKPADRLTAARELLDRAIGKASPGDLQERFERLEAEVSEARRQRAGMALENFTDDELAALRGIVHNAERRAGRPVPGEG